MFTAVFKTSIHIRKQLSASAMSWTMHAYCTCFASVTLTRLDVYMIDLQCVKTCQKQIRRKKHVNEFYRPFAFVIYGLSVMTAARALCDECAVTVVCLFLRGSESMQWSCDWARSTVGWSKVVDGEVMDTQVMLSRCVYWMLMRVESPVYTAVSVAAGQWLWDFLKIWFYTI